MTPTPMPHEGINAFDGRALLVVLLLCVCVVVVGYILTAWGPEDVLDAHDEAERVRREVGDHERRDRGATPAGVLVLAVLLLAALAFAASQGDKATRPVCDLAVQSEC